MKKFEYKILTINVSHLSKSSFQAEIDKNFNTWGNLGWELIKVEPITSGGLFWHGATTDKFLMVFKRKKIDEA